jgi:hypothetical protein
LRWVYDLTWCSFNLFTWLVIDWHCTNVGTANNAGAILVLGRDLVVVPKLIHPLPPAITSPETSPDHIEDTWMQVKHYFVITYFFIWTSWTAVFLLLTILCMEFHSGAECEQTSNSNQGPSASSG